MKRVGLLLSVKPHGGGMFQYNQVILDAVASLPKDSFEVIIGYTSQIWFDHLKNYSLKTVYVPLGLMARISGRLARSSGLPMSWWRSLSSYLHPVARTMINQKCDLWIFPSQEVWSYQVKVPSLAAIHDLMHRYERSFPEVSADGEYEKREKLYSNMCKWVKGVLVDSEVGRRHVYESYGMPGEKVFVLPYVPPRYIYSNKISNGFANKYKLPRKYIFYPAQFWEHKNHERLIKAIAVLKKDIEDIHLVLVGSRQNGYEKARRLVDELNLQCNVLFMGYVPDEDMPHFYLSARALVMPTFFGPTNIPQLEAFALGCPTATSGIYGIPEQVGDAALLFNPHSVEEIAHCISRLWLDDNLCKELIEKGKLRSAGWGQLQFNQRLLEIIQQVI